MNQYVLKIIKLVTNFPRLISNFESKVPVLNHWVYTYCSVLGLRPTQAKGLNGTMVKDQSGIWDPGLLISVCSTADPLWYSYYSLLSPFCGSKKDGYSSVKIKGEKNRKHKKRWWFASSFPPSSGNLSYTEIPKFIHQINMHSFLFLLPNLKDHYKMFIF